MRTKLKNLFYWLITILIVISVAELAGYFGLWYNSRKPDSLNNNHYFQIRAMLLGNKDPDLFPKYLTLPYLGYIPYPGYRKYGVVQHNEDGYRGNRVPLQRSGSLRILCLGGSTTYGYGVDSPYQAYPARLEAILDEKIHQDSVLSSRFKGVEVINAGIDAGTSAEELEQYLFKYRYYQPDIVIVHSGINDSQLAAQYGNGDMQLDYTDKRRILFHHDALQGPSRYLMYSYFISFCTISMFFDNTYNRGADFNKEKGQTYCKWSSFKMDTVIAQQNWNFFPFYKNTKTLFEQISHEGSLLIVMPNIVNRTLVNPNSKYAQITILNAGLSQQLCDSVSGYFLPFYFDSISRADSWLDDCHLNAVGEQEKARMVANFILKTSFRDALLKR